MTKAPARKGKTTKARKAAAGPSARTQRVMKAVAKQQARKAAAPAKAARKAPAPRKGGAKLIKAPAKIGGASPEATLELSQIAYRGPWADTLEAAHKGKLPPAPDFDKPTHAGYRKRLAALVALIEANDMAALASLEMQPPVSASRTALWRHRELSLIALRAKHHTKGSARAGK